MEINQYNIVVVNLDPTMGSELKKTRPAIVISPNEMNTCLNTIIIAPITSSSKAYPTRHKIKHPKVKGWVVLDQVRTVDRLRITKNIGVLTEKDTEKIKLILKEIFVD